MSIVMKYYGKNEPGPSVEPIRVINDPLPINPVPVATQNLHLAHKSLMQDPYSRNIELVGDQQSPGPNGIYGTDLNGRKGWVKAQPMSVIVDIQVAGDILKIKRQDVICVPTGQMGEWEPIFFESAAGAAAGAGIVDIRIEGIENTSTTTCGRQLGNYPYWHRLL